MCVVLWYNLDVVVYILDGLRGGGWRKLPS
jgi:hypothetical protein